MLNRARNSEIICQLYSNKKIEEKTISINQKEKKKIERERERGGGGW